MAINYKNWFQNNPNAFNIEEPFLQDYMKFFSINSQFKVLDIGCNAGANLLPFIQLGCENIYGIDKERDPIISFSNQVLKEYGTNIHKSLHLNIGSIEDYIFPTEFNVITAFRVLQHISKKDSIDLIHRIQNNTKKDGYNLFIIWENGQNYNFNAGYFDIKEITELYSNLFINSWNIIHCERKKIKGYSAIYFAAKKIR